MDLAWISLAELVIAITLSMVTSVNVGVVSLALAWIVGVYLGVLLELTDNLLAPLIAHALYDAVALDYTRRAIAAKSRC